ncbi:MAG: helix-turn-helix transcriptional regulator [Spirosomataceae bacterium]
MHTNSITLHASILWIPETLALLISPVLVCYVRSLLGFSNPIFSKWLLIPAGMYIKVFSYFYVASYIDTNTFHQSNLYYAVWAVAYLYSFIVAIWMWQLWIYKYRYLIQRSSYYWVGGGLGYIMFYSLIREIEVGMAYFYGIAPVVQTHWLMDGSMLTFLVGILIFGLPTLLTPIMAYVQEEKSWQASVADVSLQMVSKKELCPKLRETYIRRIKDVLEEQHIYLNPKITLSQFAKSINMNPHDLSSIINKEWNLNFNELINSYRVDKAKELLQDEKYNNETMLAIATDAGFNSESSFYSVFKKTTGYSPKRFKDSINFTPKS